MPYTPLSGYSQAASLYNQMSSGLDKVAANTPDRLDLDYERTKKELLIKKAQEESRAMDEEKFDQWRVKSLLQQAYGEAQSEQSAKKGMNLDQLLADHLDKAGQEAILQGVNPKLAQDFFKKSDEYKNGLMKTQHDQLVIDGLKTDRAGEILGSVTDEKSWNDALPELAKIGIVPPSTKYGPDAQDWANRKAEFSSKVRGAKNLELRASLDEARKQNMEDKMELEKQKQADKEQQEALKQAYMQVPRTKDPYLEAGDIGSLPKFEDLDQDQLLEAAKQIEPLSKYYLTTKQATNGVEARQLAIKELQGRVTADGKLAPMAGVSKDSEGNDIAAAVKAAGQTYEPEKYDYRVVNGQVQRKAK